MLVKLTVDQIIENWEGIKGAIIASLPPTASVSSLGINNIYKKLLNDLMQAWAYEDNGIVLAFIVTVISIDTGTEEKNLFIYSIQVTKTLSNDIWYEGLETLRKFADQQNCNRIIAFTNIPAIEKRVKDLGGRVDFKLVSLKV